MTSACREEPGLIPKAMTLDAGFVFRHGRKKAKEHTGLPRWAARVSAGASGLLACPVVFSTTPPTPCIQEPRHCRWGLSFPGSGGSPGCWEVALLLDQHHEVERDLSALKAPSLSSSNTRHISQG